MNLIIQIISHMFFVDKRNFGNSSEIYFLNMLFSLNSVFVFIFLNISIHTSLEPTVKGEIKSQGNNTPYNDNK